MTERFKTGDLVFFLHPIHSWIYGTVTTVAKGYSCRAEDVKRNVVGETVDKLKEEQVTQAREDLLEEDVDDLLQLTILHDATLVRCLFIRYMKDIIYTNIGAIVVALNPFNFKIPHYMDDKMGLYLAEGDKIEKNLPHSWAQAHNTYNEMMIDGKPGTSEGNQCILISGESGAGKTEAAKIVMKYLAGISCKKATDAEKVAGLQVGTRLSQCSPILEAFGNARTVRNDNSSRFGKFMKVKFTKGGLLVGAHTTKYLLEKSRIVTASPGERVYHAFYVVTRGCLAGDLGLVEDTQYKSLNAGKTLHNKEFDTKEDFQEVLDGMTTVGMTKPEIMSTWCVPAAVLSIQNIVFTKEGEGCVIDPACMSYVNNAVKVLQIDKVAFMKELVTTSFELKGQITCKLLNPTLAIDGRDALCKAMYDLIFGWLVDKCNSTCDVEADGNWVGLLDIFGFEDFELNSFEQVCINLANETLQNHYNSFIFTKDLEECRAEGIDMDEVKCPDNGPCLTLISGKGGILAALDEECAITTGTDKGFLDKITLTHAKNPFFVKDRLATTSFIVKHYAGDVSYQVANFLEKNRDTLKDAIKLIMRASKDSIIAALLPDVVEKKGPKVTVGGFFKSQVGLLMDVINGTNPHWIRCVKPHPAKKPLMFGGVSTMNQLESSGVLGTVKIRKAGYPIRLIFEKFFKRYEIIVRQEVIGKKIETKEVCKLVLAACGVTEKKFTQVGKTKVFMKSEAYPIIERKRNEAMRNFVILIQKCGRGEKSRKETVKLLIIRSTQIIQFEWRDLIARRVVCSKLLQKEWRDYLVRTSAFRAEKEARRLALAAAVREIALTLSADLDAHYVAFNAEYMSGFNAFIRERNEIEAGLIKERMWETEKKESIERKEIDAEEAKDRKWLNEKGNDISSVVEVMVVQQTEKECRLALMSGTFATDYNYLVNAFVEGLYEMAALKERQNRADIVAEERPIISEIMNKAYAGYFNMTFDYVYTWETENRKGIVAAEESEWRGMRQDHSRAVSWAFEFRRDDSSEIVRRCKVAEEEDRMRQRILAFSFQQSWVAMLLRLQREEATDRAIIDRRTEPFAYVDVKLKFYDFMLKTCQRGCVGSENDRRQNIKKDAEQEWDRIMRDFEFTAFDAFRLRSGRLELERRRGIERTEREQRVVLRGMVIEHEMAVLQDGDNGRSEPATRKDIERSERRARRYLYYTQRILNTNVLETIVRGWLADLHVVQFSYVTKREGIERAWRIGVEHIAERWEPLLQCMGEAVGEYVSLVERRAQVQVEHYRSQDALARASMPQRLTMTPNAQRAFYLTPERRDEVQSVHTEYRARMHTQDVFDDLWGTYSVLARQRTAETGEVPPPRNEDVRWGVAFPYATGTKKPNRSE